MVARSEICLCEDQHAWSYLHEKYRGFFGGCDVEDYQQTKEII